MTIIGRVARLLKSEVHGILDSLEEPHAALKQAIRDMEASIAKDEEELAALGSRIESCSGQLEARSKRVEELASQVKLSFESNNEKLAKSFLRKKLENEKQITLIKNNVKKFGGEKEQQARLIEERREKLEQIKEKLGLFVSEASAKESSASPRPADEFSVSEEEVELAFLEECKKYSTASSNTAAKS